MTTNVRIWNVPIFGHRPERVLGRQHLMGLVPAVALALCLWAPCLGGSAAATTIKRHMVFEGHEGEEGREGTWLANDDGTSVRPASYTWGEPAALAPDGRTVAFALGDELKRKDIAGGSELTLYTVGPGDRIVAPRYSANGQKLIFFVEEGESGQIDIMNSDGTGRETVVTGLYPNHVTPDFSPDGTKILYTGPGPEGGLVVANADGSEPKTVETGLEYLNEAHFSPGGTKIVFKGGSSTVKGEGEEEGSLQIFTINVTGTNLKQVAHDEFAFAPEWAPKGGRVFYTAYKEGGQEQIYSANADGSGEEQRLEPSGFSSTRFAAFSPGGIDDDEYLGLNYAPILRFDSAEKWRPLNIESFMSEEDPENEGHSYNELCTMTGCDELGAEWRAEVEFSESVEGPRYLKMGQQQEGTYPYPTSPNAECHAEALVELWDCDGGPRTAIYYHVVPSATSEESSEAGYNYVDYWFFYRYNQDQEDPTAIDDHEGDWEGLTVAPSVAKPGAIDFAIFAQHHNNYVYLPEMLECDEGGGASCGSSESPSGQRVWDYVAVGTHASYPEMDTGGVLEGCTQHESALPDGCHDGEAPWAGNGDAANVLPLPSAGVNGWADWPGRWGNSEGISLPFEAGWSPPSPGLQARYKCPWKWYEGDPTACPSKVNGATGTEAREASACGNWFGASIVAAVCSPSLLRKAIAKASLGHEGGLHIRLGRRRGRVGSRAGVAQASGAPLRPGESLVVEGRTAGDTILLVKVRAAGRLIDAAFSHLDLTYGGRGVVKALRTPRGVRLAWIGPDGRSILPSSTRIRRVPRQATSSKTARRAALLVPRHRAAQSTVARPPVAPEKALARLRACQRTAAADRVQLHTLIGHNRHSAALQSKLRVLHEKLAYRKC
jgi:Tol biopolymer transport system component